MDSPSKSALIPWNPEDSVWKRIHVDFAGPIRNHYFMVVVDSYSKWSEVEITKQITRNFTVKKLRELFCRYGLIDVLVTDNGRQFTSQEYKTFMEINGIKHVLTAPGHPATNGQAEIFVKVLKKSILATLDRDCHGSLETITNRFLADCRNSPHCTTGETPAKLFFGRSLKTRFDLMSPPTVSSRILQQQEKSIKSYKGNRLESLNQGQKVYIRDYTKPNKASWSQATIDKSLGSRTYLGNLAHNHRIIKRHTDQIRAPEDNTKQMDNTDTQNEKSKVCVDSSPRRNIGIINELKLKI